MNNINNIVVQEMIAIRIKSNDVQITPNSKVEVVNLGTPKIFEIPQGDPDFYKNFTGNNLTNEKTDIDVPTNLSSGMSAGDRLKNAIKSNSSQNK